MDGWMDGWMDGGIGKKQMLSVHPSVTENPESDQSVTIPVIINLLFCNAVTEST
jgi:hypothetical protein